jgi:DNA-binding transcriptional MocR family regulator
VQQLAITGANLSGGTPGQLASIVVQDLITSGQADIIIAGLIKVYKSRAQTMIRSIKKYLPACTNVYGGEGGYFLWVTINADIDHTKIVDMLKEEHNIILASGNNFEVCGDEKGWGKNSVRLSVSFLNEHEIEKGIRKWGDVLRRKHIEVFKN